MLQSCNVWLLSLILNNVSVMAAGDMLAVRRVNTGAKQSHKLLNVLRKRLTMDNYDYVESQEHINMRAMDTPPGRFRIVSNKQFREDKETADIDKNNEDYNHASEKSENYNRTENVQSGNIIKISIKHTNEDEFNLKKIPKRKKQISEYIGAHLLKKHDDLEEKCKKLQLKRENISKNTADLRINREENECVEFNWQSSHEKQNTTVQDPRTDISYRSNVDSDEKRFSENHSRVDSKLQDDDAVITYDVDDEYSINKTKEEIKFRLDEHTSYYLHEYTMPTDYHTGIQYQPFDSRRNMNPVTEHLNFEFVQVNDNNNNTGIILVTKKEGMYPSLRLSNNRRQYMASDSDDS